ncbi:MAG TPA: hypothetical protein VNO52_17500, partial [Methylomirabilota bacterium]|nr:hypothetical protein [Methylomirabilota bacterium]
MKVAKSVKKLSGSGGRGRGAASAVAWRGFCSGWVLWVVWLAAVASRGGAAEWLPPLAPIFVGTNRAGGEELTPLRPVGGREAGFLAVVTNEWPAGLVPLFSVEAPGGVELRRRPLKGQENFTEPVFFVLPPADEPMAGRLAGRWDCRATRADGSKSYVIWELTAEGVEVAGRFDQRTEYRVAFVAG